jgi:RHS repeat-associated protein
MLYTLRLLGRRGGVAVATRAFAFVAAVLLGLASSPALAQLSCNPSGPRTDPGTGFVPFGTLERLEVRSGRLGAADWEWGLGVNTQSAGQFATANLDWVNERVYDWTLSYSGTGSATIEVRDGGALLFTRTWATGIDAGNALKLYVKSTAGIAAGNLVTATSATINGQPAAASIQTAGTGAFSEQSLYWFYPPMSQGFTATGTVKLTFTGSYPPTGSRLNFIVTAGNIPCTPPPQAAKLYFIHTDHLNTPRLIADDQQRTVWRWDNTDPFGGNPSDENPSGLGTFEFDLGFPGQRRDRETGLWYNGQRDGYNPATGTYTQPEPIGLEGDINLYRYARNNPLTFVDPNGQNPIAGATIGGILGGPPGAAIGGVIGLAIGVGIGIISQSSPSSDECKPCQPCKLIDGTIVPLGTIAYRWDSPSKPQHGIVGEHLNLYKANQNPNNCRCFWQGIGTVPPPPQSGWIPIQPFAN